MEDQSHDRVCCQSSHEQVVHNIYQRDYSLVRSELESFRTQSRSQTHKNFKFPGVFMCSLCRELKPDRRIVRSMESSERQRLFPNHTTGSYE